MEEWEQGKEEAERQSRNKVFGGIRSINAPQGPVTDLSSQPAAGQRTASPFANIRTGGGQGGIAPNYGIGESRYSVGPAPSAGFMSGTNGSITSPANSRGMRRGRGSNNIDNSDNSTNESGNITVTFGDQRIDQSVNNPRVSGARPSTGSKPGSGSINIGSGNTASNQQQYGDTNTSYVRARPNQSVGAPPAKSGRRSWFSHGNGSETNAPVAQAPASDVEGLAQKLTGRPATDPTQVMPVTPDASNAPTAQMPATVADDATDEAIRKIWWSDKTPAPTPPGADDLTSEQIQQAFSSKAPAPAPAPAPTKASGKPKTTKPTAAKKGAKAKAEPAEPAEKKTTAKEKTTPKEKPAAKKEPKEKAAPAAKTEPKKSTKKIVMTDEGPKAVDK